MCMVYEVMTIAGLINPVINMGDTSFRISQNQIKSESQFPEHSNEISVELILYINQ